MIELRPYQQECVDVIDNLLPGSYLIQMATGLGKTVTFSQIKRRGRMLILSHREELVNQPRKYFNCSYGIEMATQHSNGEEVVSASVQTLVRRLDHFRPDDFDILITDEAHHAAAKTYKKIYSFFEPRLHLGFTATPNRGDHVRLDDVYQDIVFQRDLRWGIKNNYLSDIYCLRANIGYDLRQVARRMGDYAPGELEKAMNIEGQNKAIAEAYQKYAKGQTLIFATSVDHARAIAAEIPGAFAITAETKNRQELIDAFTRREIPVLVNCMIFTEGTDIPLVETIIIARPTQNDSLYAQMVGRGLRLYPGKDKLTLIDCVGVTGRNSICTAPSLIGVDASMLPPQKQDEVIGNLFDLPEVIKMKSDTPESWIRNMEIVNLWAKEQDYALHDVNWFKMPNGDFVCHLLNRAKLVIPAQDELGHTTWAGKKVPMQDAFDQAYLYLKERCSDSEYIWNLKKVKRWKDQEASEKQKTIIKRRLKTYDVDGLTKFEASQILNRLFN